jgi:hypothetical protein
MSSATRPVVCLQDFALSKWLEHAELRGCYRVRHGGLAGGAAGAVRGRREAGQVAGRAEGVRDRAGRDVDGRITWTSRLKLTSVLHELPPPRTGRSGRPRTRGGRLGTPTDLAADATAAGRWRATRVRRYGRTDAVQITERPVSGTDRFAAVPCG